MNQTWKNTKSLHNLNSIYFSYTGLFLGFTKEIAGKIKKFTQIWKNVHKHGLQVCAFFHVCIRNVLALSSDQSLVCRVSLKHLPQPLKFVGIWNITTRNLGLSHLLYSIMNLGHSKIWQADMEKCANLQTMFVYIFSNLCKFCQSV